MKKTVCIIGATSDLARELARCYAKAGYDLFLLARNAARLEPLRLDLSARYGATATVLELDVRATETFDLVLENVLTHCESVVYVAGVLGDQQRAEMDNSHAIEIMEVNYSAGLLLLHRFAEVFEIRRAGVIVGISSVAGERGRKKNYVYGSAKAGFTVFLSGLRNRLNDKGVQVTTVLPGFLDTKMTAGMPLPKFLTATPQEAAACIFKAVQRQKDIVYVRPIWRWIMLIIKHLPEFLFKKMDL